MEPGAQELPNKKSFVSEMKTENIHFLSGSSHLLNQNTPQSFKTHSLFAHNTRESALLTPQCCCKPKHCKHLLAPGCTFWHCGAVNKLQVMFGRRYTEPELQSWVRVGLASATCGRLLQQTRSCLFKRVWKR